DRSDGGPTSRRAAAGRTRLPAGPHGAAAAAPEHRIPPGTDPPADAAAGPVRAARERRVRGAPDEHRRGRAAAGLPVTVRAALTPPRRRGQPGSRRPPARLPEPADPARPRGREGTGPGMDGIAEPATAAPSRPRDAPAPALAAEPASAGHATAAYAPPRRRARLRTVRQRRPAARRHRPRQAPAGPRATP